VLGRGELSRRGVNQHQKNYGTNLWKGTERGRDTRQNKEWDGSGASVGDSLRKGAVEHYEQGRDEPE